MSDPGWKPDDAEKVCAQCGKSFAGRSCTVNLHPEEFCTKVCVNAFYEPISEAEIAWRKLSATQKERTAIYDEIVASESSTGGTAT